MNSLSLQKKLRRGSLPFKKRPFSLVQSSVVILRPNGGLPASPRKQESLESSSQTFTSSSSTSMLPASFEQLPLRASNNMVEASSSSSVVGIVSTSSFCNSDNVSISTTTDDADKFAALALMAAAASSTTVSPAAAPTTPPPSFLHHTTLPSSLPTHFSALETVAAAATAIHPESIMMPVVHALDGQENANSSHLWKRGGAEDHPLALLSPRTSPATKKRLIHRAQQEEEQGLWSTSPASSPRPTTAAAAPPLTSPLPGGCHGRTSRTHFYCKRRPCYKGSNYCKLHYQHYVLEADNEDNMKTCREASTSQGHAPKKQESTTLRLSARDEGIPLSPSGKKKKSAVSMPVGQQSPIQNRRYTGRSCEERCSATTTRGRECAFVAVQGSKYCNLHADYDVNPSPRRSSNGSDSAASTSHAQHHKHPGAKRKDKRSSKASSRPGLAFRPSSSQVSLTSTSDDTLASFSSSSSPRKPKAVKRQRSSNSAPNSPSPKRRCTTAKLAKKHADSPFPLLSMFSTDQWMHKKVKIATGPLAGSVGKVEKWSNGWVSVKVPGVGLHNRRSFELCLVQEEEQQSSSGQEQEHDALKGEEKDQRQRSHGDDASEDEKRALLRCVSREASSPSPLTMTKPFSALKKKKSMAHKNRHAAPATSAAAPTEIPQSPCPTRQSVDVLKTPVPQQQQVTAMTNLVPKVTPQMPKMTEKDVPLVKSLLLAQEGNGKLDLLFGTAALERSRRTVRKPNLYEDKTLLEKKQGGTYHRHNNSTSEIADHHNQRFPFKKRAAGGHSSPTEEVTGNVDE